MELHDLSQIAENAGLPLSLVRYYRDRFIMFVPSVRVGRSVLYPSQAVEVLQTIDRHAKAGSPASEIELILEAAYPVTVICSQEVPAEGFATDSFSAIRALAAEFDRRESRVETGLSELREQLNRTITADQVRTLIKDLSPAPVHASAGASGGLDEVKHSIDELRSHVSMLASREQLEWIGDVVAAAALRPVTPQSEVVSEKAFTELVSELQKVTTADDVAELRAAVARLAEDVNRRDAEFGKAFRTLVGALKQELGTLRGAVRDVQTTIETEHAERFEPVVHAPEPIRVVEPTPMPAPAYAGPTAVLPTTDQLNADILGNDAIRSRSPRRLGQPLRPTELIPTELDAAPGAD